MRVDDLKSFILANSAAAIAARSTPEVPLSALVAAQVVLRDDLQPERPVVVYLDDGEPDEREPLTVSTDSVTWRPELYVVISRGATEAKAREAAHAYALALADCLKMHPDFFGIRALEDFDGMDGKPDYKVTKLVPEMKYEE